MPYKKMQRDKLVALDGRLSIHFYPIYMFFAFFVLLFCTKVAATQRKIFSDNMILMKNIHKEKCKHLQKV